MNHEHQAKLLTELMQTLAQTPVSNLLNLFDASRYLIPEILEEDDFQNDIEIQLV